MAGKPYRKNVGIVVFNRAGEVLLGERVNYPGSLQFPQGGIDPGEEPGAAALRELEEEIGLRLSGPPNGEIKEWLRYDFPPDIPKKLRKFQGQEQKWYFYFWDGPISELDLDAHEREFSSVRWGTLEDALASIVSFKRELYQEVTSQARVIISTFLREV